VKLPKELVRGQAEAKIEGRRMPSAFSSSYKTKAVVRHLPDLVRKVPSKVAEQAALIKKGKAEFEAGIARLRSKMLLKKKNVTGRPPKLVDAITENAPFCVRSLLARLGSGTLSDIGVASILSAPAPRMYAAVHVAYVYFQVVREWAPAHGDGYDLLHAVAATAADEFVSRDKRLRELVQAAGGGIPKVWDLPAFIESVDP
jgi:hypothetical protein